MRIEVIKAEQVTKNVENLIHGFNSEAIGAKPQKF